ncbi:MAG: DUF6036 family nucleotidyltransferase [Micropruina sp.]
MRGAGREFTRGELIGLLTEVGQILSAKGLTATIYVVGGAAMALTLASRRSTRDVDAFLRDHVDELGAAASEVAARHNLDPHWFNSAATMFLASEPDTDTGELTLEGLRVMVASPEYLLAMKLRAVRGKDMADLEWLFTFLGITHPQQAADITNRLFDDTSIGWEGPDEARYAAEDVFAWAGRQGRPIGTLRIPAEASERASDLGGAWRQTAELHRTHPTDPGELDAE